MTPTMSIAAVLGLALVVMAAMRGVEAAITCGQVSGGLGPCLPYLEAKAPSPSAGCCSGVRGLYSATKANRADRVTACGCIKSLASAVGGLKSQSVAALPGKCGVSLGYTPSLSINCASIP